MEWFSGSIPEAINLCKSQNSVFIVFITDGSEASAATEACLSRAEGLRQSSVAIKLASNSEESRQFNQIYPILVLPSLYFINPSNGVPVEILAGAVTDENLAARIPTILKDCTSQNTPDTVPEALEQTSTESPTSLSVTEDPIADTATEPPAPVSSSVADPLPESAASDEENTTQIIPDPLVEESISIPSDQTQSTPVATNEIAEGTNVEPSTSASSVPEPTLVSPSNAASPLPVPSVGAENSQQKDAGLESQDGGESSLSLEDRVARARKLAELKKQQREEELLQKEHEEEIKRRQMGKSIRQMKQEQEDKELRDLAAERKRDKEMDRLAREKVKAQIAADRAEREERNALLRGNAPTSPAAPQPTAAPSSSSATFCRLKLRLPDGSSELAQFEPSVMLSEVRQHVQQNIKLPFTRFKLVSSVHQRPFTDQDMNTSLADLGLAPSAIVLVMPSNIGGGQNGDGNGSGGVVSVSTSWFQSLMWLIMLPVNAVMGIVSSFFGGTARGTRPQASTSEASDGAAAQPSAGNVRRAAERPKSAYGTRSQGRYRKEGNIHRLGNDDDEDDENNTWNGNSTQQM